MMRRAEMLPSGSGPFLMVAGAGVALGAMKTKIHTEPGCLCSGLTASAVAACGPEV